MLQRIKPRCHRASNLRKNGTLRHTLAHQGLVRRVPCRPIARMLSGILLAMCAWSVTACSSTSKPDAQAERANTAAGRANASGNPSGNTNPNANRPSLRLDEIPTINPKRGECSFVLWTRVSPPIRVLAILSNPQRAIVRINGKKMELVRTEHEGAEVFSQYPNQTFTGNGYKLQLLTSFDARENLIGGVVAPEGTLEIIDPQGWSTIFSVGGLVACIP